VLPLAATDEATAEINAPTTSTTLQIALGDALAVALLERRGFKPAEVAQMMGGNWLRLFRETF